MAREPLLLIAAFFTFFALAILYVRLDFAITKDEGTEVRLKVAGYCEKVSGHQVSIGEGRGSEVPLPLSHNISWKPIVIGNLGSICFRIFFRKSDWAITVTLMMPSQN